MPSWVAWAGFALLIASQAWIFRCLITLRMHKTPVSPYRPTQALCRLGPYGYSRNPIYLGFIAVYLGLALLFKVGWAFPLLLPAWAILHWGVIAREERYLARRFGAEYAAYGEAVRRWL